MHMRRMAQHWFNIPDHWVDYGFPDLQHLDRRTNNILERWFQTFKYDICGGKISSTVSNLITTIFERVLPRLINDRALKTAGKICTKADSFSLIHVEHEGH